MLIDSQLATVPMYCSLESEQEMQCQLSSNSHTYYSETSSRASCCSCGCSCGCSCDVMIVSPLTCVTVVSWKHVLLPHLPLELGPQIEWGMMILFECLPSMHHTWYSTHLTDVLYWRVVVARLTNCVLIGIPF